MTTVEALGNGSTKAKQRILVVDDEHDITFVLEMMLNDHYDVNAFTDPVEALASIKPGMYALVLFDYLMPKMNGFEFYNRVKKIDPDVNTCMMTAYEVVLADERGSGPAQPFDSKFVLKKPFDLVQMLAKVNEIMSDR